MRPKAVSPNSRHEMKSWGWYIKLNAIDLASTCVKETSRPRKDFHNAIAAGADNPPPIVAPHHRAHTLATHDAVAGDFLRTTPSLKRPEAETGVVAGGDEFAAIGRQGQRRDCRRVCEHGVGALTW